MSFFSCTVNQIGPAADGPNADPVIYINLTDTGGKFANQWFHAAQNSKSQMLSVGLVAMSTMRPVEAAIDTPTSHLLGRQADVSHGTGRRQDETGVQSKFRRHADQRKKR